MEPSSVEALQESLRRQAYLADRGLATSLYLAIAMQRPILLEGEAGVGKTELAKALADALDRELVRLQCYEGIARGSGAVRVAVLAPAPPHPRARGEGGHRWRCCR